MSGNHNQRLLEGEVIDSPQSEEVTRLRALNRDLTRELSDALEENERLRKRVATADAPVARLREKLGPFYQLLQAIFGDIDELAPEAAATGSATVPPKNAAVWDSWKQRLGGQCGKVIDALLLHGEMNTTQLAIAIGTRRQNVPGLIYKLNQAGLINKNANRFSLKQL